ncbi:MAG: sugar phosphate isomerase/epimerase [Acidimicrobiia bacterium]|nr:sugar phosphate isomerase/epimerase [Acidimicrobiia bacterium]
MVPTIALSNIALPPRDHAALFPAVAALGVAGIEVAPSRVWPGVGPSVGGAQAAVYRRAVEGAGMTIVGLHSLFFERPDLGLFKPEARAATLDFLVDLSALCRDLGGRTLIWGGGRRRGTVAHKDAIAESIRFLTELCPRIEGHGTRLCFEPLGPRDSDFINSAFEAIEIANAVDHPAFAVQLDAKALHENDEDDLATFVAAQKYLIHFHANQPGLGRLDQGPVDQRKMGDFLRHIGYDGFITIEQRMLNESDPMSDIRRSVAVLKECYA